jgi:hypothetical protein
MTNRIKLGILGGVILTIFGLIHIAHADIINGVGGQNFIPPQEIYDQLSTFDGSIDTGTINIPGGCYALDIILANEGTGSSAISQFHTVLLDNTDIELFTVPALSVDAGSITVWTPSASGTLLGAISAPLTGKGNLQSYNSVVAAIPPTFRVLVPANTNSQMRVAILCAK